MTEPTTLLDLEFGDDAIVVKKHPDGMYTLDVSNARLVLAATQFWELLVKWQQMSETHEVDLSNADVP